MRSTESGNMSALEPSERAGSSKVDELEQRIETCTARVGVIGLGYVGLPLVRALVDSGFSVIGFDIDPDKVTALNAGRSYIRHIGDAVITELRASGRFRATSDFS
ncbi:MAG: NAD(P)-binding domain-containing protein, partial [Pseudomonadota bacterium]